MAGYHHRSGALHTDDVPVIRAVMVIVAASAVVAAGIDGAASLARAAMYGGVLVACGVTIFGVVADDGGGGPEERARVEWLVLAAATAGAAATLATLALQVAAVSGRGWAGLVDRDAASLVLGSSSHLAGSQRLLGLIVVAYAAGRRSESPRTASLLGTVGVLITLTSFFGSGHTAAREPRTVGFAIDLVHTSTAAIWAGGLVSLAVVLRHRRPHDPAGAADVVRRFSLAAGASASLLLATGMGLSWAEVGQEGGVPFNGYGTVLLAKAAVALAALAVGGVNHFVVVPAIDAAADDAWRMLARTLRIELATVVVLVALTGILTGLDP